MTITFTSGYVVNSPQFLMWKKINTILQALVRSDDVAREEWIRAGYDDLKYSMTILGFTVDRNREHNIRFIFDDEADWIVFRLKHGV